MASNSKGAPYGAWLLLVSSIIALILAAVATFNQGNGIAYTPGTYLVLFSTSLLVVGALLLSLMRGMGRGLSVLLAVLILLDLLGTAVAAYLLEAEWLLIMMGVGLVAWLIHLVADPASGKHHRPNQRKEAVTS